MPTRDNDAGKALSSPIGTVLLTTVVSSESTSTSVVNPTDDDPPQSLFDFFGVPRDSDWGKVLSDRYRGLSTESPLEGWSRR